MLTESVLLHEAFIELFLLIIILISYYSKKIPKEHMTICLLATYILSKFFINLGHYFYHKK